MHSRWSLPLLFVALACLPVPPVLAKQDKTKHQKKTAKHPPPKPVELPELARGFKGDLTGIVTRKTRDAFDLKVQKAEEMIGSMAMKPGALVGKVLRIDFNSAFSSAALDSLKDFARKDRVTVRVGDYGTGGLSAVENVAKHPKPKKHNHKKQAKKK